MGITKPHRSTDGALVRRARQSIECYLETKANTSRHQSLRIVLGAAESADLQRLRRENATLRAALNRAERKLGVVEEAAPALFAEPGTVLYHPRADSDELAERDFFRYMGKCKDLGAQYPDAMLQAEGRVGCREYLPRLWATREEHADWLVFKHIHGEGFGPRWSSMNGLMLAIDNLQEHPPAYFVYHHRDGSSAPLKELALPPAMCTSFRELWGEEEEKYLRNNVLWDEEDSGSDAQVDFVSSVGDAWRQDNFGMGWT